MTDAIHELLAIELDGRSVSGRLSLPAGATAICILAHGAGAGMEHPFLGRCADGLAARRVATLRFQFVFTEEGGRRPDPPALAHSVVRAAAAAATRLAPGLPLYAAGKSFGARMTSQAQAITPLPGVRGIAFLGFPLHPAGKPSSGRAAHLAGVECPMLFLQGTRDALATLSLIEEITASLGPRATLHRLFDADHAFHVRRTSGLTDEATLDDLLDTMVAWMHPADRPACGNPSRTVR